MKLTFLLLAALSAFAASALDQVPEKANKLANPYAGQERARLAGRWLFGRECASCHGKDAEGKAPAPALASKAVETASPGALFWVLRNGAIHRGMPSFSHLPEQQRWQIVTYLKSLSARESAHR